MRAAMSEMCQYEQLAEFLRDKITTDLFILLISHGDQDWSDLGDDSSQHRKNEAPFRIMTKNSDDGYAPGTCIYFDDLYDQILKNALANNMSYRKYFIIDACRSGAVRKGTAPRREHIQQVRYTSYSTLDWSRLPDSGCVVLSANNPDIIGDIYANDEDPEIKLPLFSHCLLDVLIWSATLAESINHKLTRSRRVQLPTRRKQSL
jgi:hypothetical protein